MHFQLFLTQVQSKQEAEMPDAENSSQGSQKFQQEYEDEMRGPLLLRPGRDDIHAILIRACKIEEAGGVNMTKA